MARHDIEELAALRIALRSTLQTLASPIEAAPSSSSSDAPSAGGSSSSTTRPSLAHLHSALLALAHTLKKHASQLALALGKPPATIPAALPSLVELGESWKRLLWVVGQVDRDDDDADDIREEEEEGERRQRRGETKSALGREWRWWTDAVGLALTGLVRSFEDDRSLFPERSGEEAPPPSPPAATGNRSGSSSSSNSKGQPAPSPPPAYLAKMGVLFGLLDSATRPPPVGSTTTSGSSGLSRTADEAGLKRWTADGEGLVDGEREAREMAEEATAEEEEELNASSDGDDDDDKENGEEDEEATEGSEAESEDDWARLLGEAAGQKPTAAERELITATLPLLRLVRSLHSNVPSLLLPVAASAGDGSARRTGGFSLPSSSIVPSPSPPPMTDRTSLSASSPSSTTTKPSSRTDGGSGGGGNRRSVLDPLLGRSASLLASADELIASLYGPIDGAQLTDAVEGLVRAGRDLAAELDRRTKPPSPSMTTTTTDNDATSSSSSDVPDPRAAATITSSSSQSSTPARDRCGRWLALWRLQLDRVRSELVDGRLRLLLLEQQQQQQPTTGGQAGADELAGKLAQTRV